jgi:hypothetical protein
MPHESFKTPQGVLEGLVWAGVATQQIAAVPIAYGQWVASLSIAQLEPAFEIDRPNLIGLGRLCEPVVE